MQISFVPNLYAMHDLSKFCVVGNFKSGLEKEGGGVVIVSPQGSQVHIDTKRTTMATTNATGDRRRPRIVEDAADASDPVVDPPAAAGELPVALAVLLAAVAAVVAEPVLVAVVVPVPMSALPCVPPVHFPLSPLNCEASLTAAGVEPQFWYCWR